jgi:hypothetical protein
VMKVRSLSKLIDCLPKTGFWLPLPPWGWHQKKQQVDSGKLCPFKIIIFLCYKTQSRS